MFNTPPVYWTSCFSQTDIEPNILYGKWMSNTLKNKEILVRMQLSSLKTLAWH
jgi:hypothetical protein